jgi:hypothetical protein
MDDSNEMTPQGEPSRPRARVGGLSRRAATGLTAFGLLTGAFAGGYIVSHAATSTSSASPSTSSGATSSGTGSTAPAPPPDGSSTGVFHPNEDATHEAGESAQREAQENAGQRPTVP